MGIFRPFNIVPYLRQNYVVESSSNSDVITASYGSFTETGETATLAVGMAASHGTFTETGEATTLNVSMAVSHVPPINTVVILIMENQPRSYDSTNGGGIIGNANAPYINNTLAPAYAQSINYHAAAHPSLPNYLAAISGSTQGVASDYNIGSSYSSGTFIAKTIVSSLENAGYTWKAYMQSLPTAYTTSGPVGDGGGTNSSGGQIYQEHHNPFPYFNEINTSSSRLAKIITDAGNGSGGSGALTTFHNDINNGVLPNYVWVTPDLDNDMHDPNGSASANNAGVNNGDNFLSTWIPRLVGCPQWGNMLVLLIWDESVDSDTTGSNSDAGGNTAFFTISPFAKANYISGSIYYDHYSVLATVESLFGLPTLTSGDASANIMQKDMLTTFVARGQSANFNVGHLYTLAAGDGTFSESGQSATLKVGLAAACGAFSESGNAAVANYGMSVNPAGVWANGAGNNQATYNVTAQQAGVLTAGSASEQAEYSISVIPAGVLTNDAAAWQVVFVPTITPAGVWTNGAVKTQATYSPLITQAGVWTNGAGNAEGIYNVWVQPAGVLAAGTGGSGGEDYSETMTGGAYANGAATNTAVYSPAVAPAGIWVNGASVASANYNPQVVPAGAWTNGAATNTAVYSPAVAAAGVWANGVATWQAVFIPSITPAGVWTNGAVTTQSDYSPQIASAGIWANGQATADAIYNVTAQQAGVLAAGTGGSGGQTYNETTSGGAYANGSATNLATYNVTLTPAGAWAAGSATTIEIANQQLSPAGVWLNGTGSGAEDYNDVIIAPAGVLVNGSAVNEAVYAPVIVVAGSLEAGVGETTAYYSPQIAPAGFWAGGSSTTSATYNDSPSAGTWANSSALVAVVYNVQPVPFGVLGGGSAVQYKTVAIVLSPAGALANGSATPNSIYSPQEPSGACAVLNGVALTIGIYTIDSTGGVFVSGQLSGNLYFEVGYGGVFVSGGLAPNVYSEVGSGGVSVFGHGVDQRGAFKGVLCVEHGENGEVTEAVVRAVFLDRDERLYRKRVKSRAAYLPPIVLCRQQDRLTAKTVKKHRVTEEERPPWGYSP